MNNNINRNMDKSFIGYNKLKQIKELITFAFVGAGNTILEISIMNFLWWSTGVYKGNINYIFKFTTFLICSVVGYLMNKKLTFKSEGGLKDYFKYAVTFGFLSFIEAVIIAEFTKIPIDLISIGIWANMVSFMASALTGIMSFIISKFIIFKK